MLTCFKCLKQYQSVALLFVHLKEHKINTKTKTKIVQTLVAVEMAGLKVCAIVSDGASVNQKFEELANAKGQGIRQKRRRNNATLMINANQVTKIIEQIYFAKSSKLSLPQALRENLITYSLSNSKLLSNFHSRTTPSGSYWTLVGHCPPPPKQIY